MKLGENIAKNAALRENVFMMAICIELRIPLFIVGKPGSSKSLAKSVIHASMRGKSSQTDLLCDFKEVDLFSYQCSQLSTPESVIEVFNTAKMFQNKQDTKNYVAVVVLDEVGLAEDSPNLPLKALHPLLEDGTEGAGAEGKNDEVRSKQGINIECFIFSFRIGHCQRGESSLHWYLQLGPGPSKDEQRSDGDQGRSF